MNSRHVAVTPFGPEDAEAFFSLNRAWLLGHGLLDRSDRTQLADPQTHVFDHGGEIFMARVDEVAVGCCAAIPRGDGSMEIAQLAVDRSARGHGIGRRLLEAALAWGQQRHYTRAVLISNRRLRTALKLYESSGFRYAAVPPGVPYLTADVYMELDLLRWTPSLRS